MKKIGMLKKVLNENEVEVYSIDKEKSIVVKASENYIKSIEYSIINGEEIYIEYDSLTRSIIEDIEIIEEFQD
ncbi:hypothetical protein H9660_14385 [Clostridium sp. Sa3CUN1]|uniref:Uncharacterized protein n=1 Tax=Clostridium gallinarum TaxID=2762246 RepID=A0ABR8Q7D5_9CLOT|nr:hypothetical protein [Clostridium gallinarum]MBD7916332.1 hypothetical protein [Clostridium gallinarum]